MGRKTWYEPAGDLGEGYPRLLHSRYDNLFKHIISSGWAVRSDGDVEALSGFFALVEIPSRIGEFNEMLEAINTGLPASMQYHESVWPAPGWYVTTELNTGIIFVNQYFGQNKAQAAYDEAKAIYEKWLKGDDVDEIAPKPKCPRCGGERFIEVDQSVQEVGMVAERIPCPECNDDEGVDLTDGTMCRRVGHHDYGDTASLPVSVCVRCGMRREVQENGSRIYTDRDGTREVTVRPHQKKGIDLTDPDYDGPWDSRQKQG